MHNLRQIKELQKYVAILSKAGMNPDEHLTAEQRELLVSAEYFDRLNLATAYFPENGAEAPEQEEDAVEEEEEQLEGMDQQHDMIHEVDGQEEDEDYDAAIDEGQEI